MSSVLNPTEPNRRLRRPGPDAAGLLALALGAGALAGVAWWLVVDLPGYLVSSSGGASTTERGLAGFIAGDAWFSLLGAVVGLILGLVGWLRLRDLGWPLAILVVLGAVAASLVCWLVGHLLGPDDFAERLTDAPPGAFVPIQLTLRTKASLLVWPFAAIVPVLLGSSLGRDDEEPRALFSGRQLDGPGFLKSLFRERSTKAPSSVESSGREQSL